MAKSELYEVLKKELKYNGEIETFGHYKHDALFAERTLLITQELFDECLKGVPNADTSLVGVTVHESGQWSDSWGFEPNGWDGIKGTKEILKPNQQYVKFMSLLAHLNAEENDMALGYCKSYLTEFDKVTEEVTIG